LNLAKVFCYKGSHALSTIGAFVSPTKALRTVIASITFALLTQFASGPQTLGWINETVMDASGTVVPAGGASDVLSVMQLGEEGI
jgi:hypothetical protein